MVILLLAKLSVTGLLLIAGVVFLFLYQRAWKKEDRDKATRYNLFALGCFLLAVVLCVIRIPLNGN